MALKWLKSKSKIASLKGIRTIEAHGKDCVVLRYKDEKEIIMYVEADDNVNDWIDRIWKLI